MVVDTTPLQKIIPIYTSLPLTFPVFQATHEMLLSIQSVSKNALLQVQMNQSNAMNQLSSLIKLIILRIACIIRVVIVGLELKQLCYLFGIRPLNVSFINFNLIRFWKILFASLWWSLRHSHWKVWRLFQLVFSWLG